MKPQHTLATALAFLVLATTAGASAPVADVSTDASGVYFLTKVSGDFELKVSGPAGYAMSKTFTDSAPAFSIFDTDGQILADGTYTYELVNLPIIPLNTDRAEIARQPRLVQSGAFTLDGGSLVDPDLPEAFDKAQVFATDLIVQGSGCIGFDCSSSESFGFDTLRLNENNLRIHFDDTSSSASFPGNDWRLIANDSSNGGANYFAIEDATAGRTPFKVEAGAPVNTLYVEDDGDVGVGTANPVVRMHLVKGDSPTMRLEQDGSSGFTPQSWDLAGNETNFFVRDVTNGSKLPFRIKPGAPTDALFIAANGDIGLGTDSPGAGIDVRTIDNPVARFQNTTAGGSTRLAIFNGDNIEWRLTNSASNTFRIAEQNTDSTTTELELDASGNMAISGTLDVGNTSTGGNQGTSACIDSTGKLCACGSCS